MSAYYNENDPSAAAWLRELIRQGFIAPGDVDDRSVEDVCPRDLDGYTQCHFFAGIGAWSFALRQAGWPDDRPVWTGSRPCQPFSTAGQRKGTADDRHLFPAWFWLIKQCRPVAIIGEQVAKKSGDAWFDSVSDALESEDYLAGQTVFPACGVGSPQLRQRRYWVASAASLGRKRKCRKGEERASEYCDAGGLGSANSEQSRRDCRESSGAEEEPSVRELGDVSESSSSTGRPNPTDGFWRGPDWIGCRDGKWRPVESGTFPLAHGAPARVGRLRGYGNAIVVPQAVEFVKAYMEVAA